MIAHHCDGLEAVVQGNATERRVHQIHDIRWADDFIVTANSREVLEQTVLPRINSLCHQTKGASPNKLIDTLNPILRGWVNYHRHVNSAETFSRLDNHLWRRLYRWAMHRQPNKTGRWIAQRYFSHQKGKAWWFTDPASGKQLIRVQSTVKTQCQKTPSHFIGQQLQMS